MKSQKVTLILLLFLMSVGCNNLGNEEKNEKKSTTLVVPQNNGQKIDSGITAANTVTDTTKKIETNLKGAYVRFGIPNWSDAEWNGDAILSLDVLVDLESGTVKGHAEHRNDDLKRGRAFNKTITLDRTDIIEYSTIKKVKLTVNAKSGRGPGPFGSPRQSGETTQFRAEVVFVFNNGQVLSTGYNEPALLLITENVSVVAIERRPPYFNMETLVEPVQ